MTINQKKRELKEGKSKKTKCPALTKCPQKKGICLKIYITPPKKPNSAKRKVTRVRLTNRYSILCYIPGIGHNLVKFHSVLIRGGRVPDLPGVKYRVIRGKLDASRLDYISKKRSKYGAKKRRMGHGQKKTFF